MKHGLLAVILLLLFSNLSSAQQHVHAASLSLSRQPHIDSLKISLSSQGFKLVREAALNMESDYQMPVMVPLEQGKWYHFVFVGDASSLAYEISMLDRKDKEVFYKTQKNGGAVNQIIDYTYLPQQSTAHVFRPVQVNSNKKTGLFGYVMIFKRQG